MEIFHNPYYNCKNLFITAAIKRKGYQVEGLWKRIGFHFNPHSNFVVTPYYMALEKELNDYGFSLRTHTYGTVENLISCLNEYLANNLIVGIGLDLNELPYSIYYNEGHQMHAVEILGFENGEYIVCDHFYNYLGEVSKDILVDSLKSVLMAVKQPLNIYQLVEFEEVKSVSVHKIVSDNIQALEGHFQYHKQTNNSYVGIEGINEFKNQLISKFRELSSDEDRDEVFEIVYPLIKELSHSRYHFKSYIKMQNEEKLAQQIHDASQNWAVLAHLLLKANVSQSYERMLDRIESKFNYIYKKEKAIVESLKQYCTNSQL